MWLEGFLQRVWLLSLKFTTNSFTLEHHGPIVLLYLLLALFFMTETSAAMNMGYLGFSAYLVGFLDMLT